MLDTLDAIRAVRRSADGPLSGISAATRPGAGAGGTPRSSATLHALEHTLQALLTPLDYPDWQTWQVAVHAQLLALTGADTLCVYTPLADGPGAWYSPHLSDEVLAEYGRRVAADPTWEVVERRFAASGRDLAHETDLMAREAFEATPFFQEFLRPNRLFDLTIAGVDFGGRAPARLHFTNRERRSDAWQAARGALIRAVLPAFRAGLVLWRQLGERRSELARVLDALADPVCLYEATGTLMHANGAAARLLEGADGERLRAEAQRVAWGVGAMGQRAAVGTHRGSTHAGAAAQAGARTAVRELRVGTNVVRLHGALAPAWMLGREPGVLVTFDVGAPRPMSDAELRERFGLTPRELEVARHVAAGLSNQEIAEHLGVSFFTARNHVERLLPKLGVGNRARVGALLRGELP